MTLTLSVVSAAIVTYVYFLWFSNLGINYTASKQVTLQYNGNNYCSHVLSFAWIAYALVKAWLEPLYQTVFNQQKVPRTILYSASCSCSQPHTQAFLHQHLSLTVWDCILWQQTQNQSNKTYLNVVSTHACRCYVPVLFINLH